MSDLERRPQLRPGSELFLGPEGSERSVLTAALVLACEDDLIWCKGSCSPLRAGDVALLEKPVAGDARYVTTAEVEVVRPSRFALRIAGGWQRSQQREFVRINTFNLTVEIERVPEVASAPREIGRARSPRRRAGEPSARPVRLKMLDLSAGGLRFSSKDPFDLGEQIRCRFELPDAGEFGLLAKVVRVERKATGHVGRRWYSAEFCKLAQAQRSALLNWTFQEQLRRHREYKGRE